MTSEKQEHFISHHIAWFKSLTIIATMIMVLVIAYSSYLQKDNCDCELQAPSNAAVPIKYDFPKAFNIDFIELGDSVFWKQGTTQKVSSGLRIHGTFPNQPALYVSVNNGPKRKYRALNGNLIHPAGRAFPTSGYLHFQVFKSSRDTVPVAAMTVYYDAEKAEGKMLKFTDIWPSVKSCIK